MSGPSRDAVAIVGIGCRFPGGVTDPASFWKLLTEGGDAIGEIPQSRFDLAHYFDARPATPGRIMTRWGGFLQGIEDFDAAFFGISPREAERLDPQQRLVLETAWEALEDAGLDTAALDGSHTGVFVGQWLSDFEGRLFTDPEEVDFFMTTGSGRYATSGRLSYLLGLRGPSLTLDTACSSSLAAVHLAARSIRSGESDLAIAGGANVILQPHISIAYSQSRMMAPDGRCKFGDARGDGYVRSEGAGLVVLKSLARALADGDRVYAVIEGSALNNDGRSSGSMGTPSQAGQEDLLRKAYRDAGRSPGEVSYIEAHGTGTRAGDPVELGALGAVLSEGRVAGHRASVGSVKTNLGHTEGAAGVAGLIKVALSLFHEALPPSLHCHQPNPAIPWATLPFEVQRTGGAWPQPAAQRLAGVSAFGIAGTNAHVVLAGAPSPETAAAPVSPQRDAALLVLSARDDAALRALAGRYAQQLSNGASLPDVCWNAATRRTALERRASFVAADTDSMIDALRRHGGGEAATAEGTVHGAQRPKVAFICPGQGAQWQGMARELMQQEPAFLAALERCDTAMRPYADWSIVTQLNSEPGSPEHQLDRIDVIQPVLVALSVAYAALWRELGVVTDAVVGHSMGEVAAACVAGVLSLDQAMRIICRRSALMRRTSGQGAMALVDLSMADAQARLVGREHEISVAVSNSPRSSVISGRPEAVQAVLAELERDNVFCRLVKVDVASHSPQMQPLADELRGELTDLAPQASEVTLYSTVLARRAEGAEFGAGYWADNLRQPVRFGTTVERMLADGITVFIELGPHPVLLPSVEQTAQGASTPITAIACARRNEPEQASLLTAVGALYCAGFPLDWSRVMPSGGRFVGLPTYPWQRERHWVAAADMSLAPGRAGPRVAPPDPASLGWLHQLTWAPSEAPKKDAPAGERWLIATAPAESACARSLAGALVEAGSTARVVPLGELEVALAGGSVDRLAVLAVEEEHTAYLPLRAARALLAMPARERARIWFITRGAQVVVPGEKVHVLQAAAWGSARVVAEEHPELWGGLIDLDAQATPEADAGPLAGHLQADDGEDQVAFRGHQRFATRLKAFEGRLPGAPFTWRADAAYLITGGLGGVGLHVARAMVRAGARRLVLLSRTSLPARESWSTLDPASALGRRVTAVREIEALGAAVHVAAVDVADASALTAFLAQYAAQAWPAIRGVIHAAGNFDNHLVSDMDPTAFDNVLAPKLGGARLLDALLPDLDLFVTFSSTGAFLAQAGQANYAAANAALDALVINRRVRGQPGLSVGWGVWADTGLVSGAAGERLVAEMARQGIRAFTPEQGTALFPWLCASPQAHLVVLPMDWDAFGRARAGRGDALFRELVSTPERQTLTAGAVQQMAHAEPAERRRLMEALVKEAACAVLKMPLTRLDPRKALGAMGLNSLMAMELRNRLEAALGRSLSATLAWNYPTVEALAAHLSGDDAEPPPGPRSTASTDSVPGVAPVAALSEEDALLALRGSRRRGRP